MSRYGNLKAGPDNQMTAADERCWRDLIDAAEAAAQGRPSAAAPDLKRVAEAARNACAPGVVTRDNPCVVLAKLARRYVGETTAGRGELQGQMATAAEAARECLNAGGRRGRKDIDG
ncbi:MAG: hypothetical protein ACK4OJ_12005 [Brevundimonas sp.]